MRSKLHYMGDKEARVCSVCYQDLIRGELQHNSEYHSTGKNIDICEKVALGCEIGRSFKTLETTGNWKMYDN